MILTIIYPKVSLNFKNIPFPEFDTTQDLKKSLESPVTHKLGKVLDHWRTAGKPNTPPASGVSYGDIWRGAFRLLTGNK